MNSKTKTVFYFIGVSFIFASVYVSSVEGVRCSPMHHYISLSKRESHCFELSDSLVAEESSAKKEELSVTFLGVESHYHVPQMYAFFPPNVSVICECSCDDSSTSTCSEDTYYKHDKCARHKNDQSVCSLYYKSGTDVHICPLTYKLCCQVYFAIPNAKGSKYYGLNLNKHENSIQLSLSLNITANGKLKKHLTFHIPKHVRRFQFDNDSVITLSVVSPNEALPDDWYFVQDGSHELMTGINLNKIGEQDFRKLGWFQVGQFGPDKREELLSIDSRLIENFLRIYPLKCQTPTPRYDWDFPAKYYQKAGSPMYPIIGKAAMQIHGLFVSNITVDVDKQSVIVDHRNPPELRILVSKSTQLLEELIFNATIYQQRNYYTLKLNFTFGKKITYLVNVAYGEREISEDFYVTIYKSQAFPVEHSIRLNERISSPTWVCLYEQTDTQKQLCRLAEVFRNTSSREDDPQAETLAEADNYEMKEVYYDDSCLKTIVIIALFLAILSLVVQAVFCFLFYKKAKFRKSVSRTPSTEHIKKDGVKDDKIDADGNRYSHLYEFLRPTHAVKPLSNEVGTDSV